MLGMLSLALVLSGTPRVLSVSALEPQGEVTSLQLAQVRDAVISELKAQGYDARADVAGATTGRVGGALMKVKDTYAVMLKLTETATGAIVSTTTVRCGKPEQLPDAAREAASQLAREGREQWGVGVRFVPTKK